MIKVLIGDMFESEAQTLVNTVNCVGVMGKGIAQEFKKRFPDMFESYKRECDTGTMVVGKPSLYSNLFEKRFILNFPTKNHWKSPTLIKDIEDGLDYFIGHYKNWGITSIAFPPLGCGNGGLSWIDVGPLMYVRLKDLDIPVEIYAPYGTSTDQLRVEFLQDMDKTVRTRGFKVRGALTFGEVAILEVLYRLQNERYAKPIGRVMYQKTCYLLTQSGVDTGFVFMRNDFGPFSSEAKNALTIYANNNLIREEKFGAKMLRLTVTEQYKNIRSKYLSDLQLHAASINKTIDLLRRIKDTDQGEEVATVIYAAKMVQTELKGTADANDVLKYVLNWKRRWEHNSDKVNSLKETIDNLNVLSWLSIKDSASANMSIF